MVLFVEVGKIGRGRETESGYFCLDATKFEITQGGDGSQAV